MTETLRNQTPEFNETLHFYEQENCPPQSTAQGKLLLSCLSATGGAEETAPAQSCRAGSGNPNQPESCTEDLPFWWVYHGAGLSPANRGSGVRHLDLYSPILPHYYKWLLLSSVVGMLHRYQQNYLRPEISPGACRITIRQSCNAVWSGSLN